MNKSHNIRLQIPLVMLISMGLYSFAIAQHTSLRQAMGKTTEVIEHHTRLETARLQIVSYTESREHPLVYHRIGGYPIVAKPAMLDNTTSHKVAALLLDDNNYNHNEWHQCVDHGMLGMRFTKGKQKVEVSIGTDCHQVVVSFRDGVETTWWEEIMKNEAAKRLFGLLGNY